jgi:FixJ family two-component response regulator
MIASMTAIVVGVDDDRRVLESIESLMASAGTSRCYFRPPKNSCNPEH